MNIYSKTMYFLLILVSCSSESSQKQLSGNLQADLQGEQTNRSTDLIPEPDLVARLENQRALIDTAFSRSELTIEILVKELHKEELTKVLNEVYPEVIETTFNIWRDSEGMVKIIGEYPHSESDDWNIAYLHYFDKGQKTFAFMRATSFYNSMCTEDFANEEIIEYYSKDFNRIDRLYSLKDTKGQELNKDSCVINYDFPYVVFENLEKYIKSKF